MYTRKTFTLCASALHIKNATTTFCCAYEPLTEIYKIAKRIEDISIDIRKCAVICVLRVLKLIEILLGSFKTCKNERKRVRTRNEFRINSLVTNQNTCIETHKICMNLDKYSML